MGELDAELTLSVSEAGASVEQLEEAGGLLREELLELDVAAVRGLPVGVAELGQVSAEEQGRRIDEWRSRRAASGGSSGGGNP